jgi:cytochrome-b5 reductase
MTADYPMILTERPPIRNLVPPGQCQFTPTFQSVPLLDRIPCGTGGTSFLLRFGLPDPTKAMDLTTCACLLAKGELMDDEKKEVVSVIRPYTPISANDQVGCFDLLIKDYGDSGWLSRYMCEELKVGEMVDFKHIDFNIKIPAPFTHKKIGMIAGGTGITPMIQALHAILGEGPESQKSATDEVTLLYGSRNKDDILGGEMLEQWASDNDNFNHVDVLSNEPADSEFKGERGFIDKEKCAKYLPPASLGDDVVIFICGPPIMYELLCGPRNEKEVTGILGELGYSEKQVFKF